MAVTRFLLTLKPGAVDSRFEVNDFLGKAFQFTAVNFARNSEPKETSPEEKNHARIMNSEQKEDNVSEHSSGVNEKNGWFCHLVFRDVTKVDLVSRILFPLTFSVFSIAYWTYYLMIYNTA
ncbi:hypothetical protein TNIN_359721 [Trichonephila inaurata madagascariensis]|uniref:Uncharacterized protein n=1 Tax=Trichonephila inaurata madagascariensis TaxID=2747483 RepID=A0A8X6IM38_9ARAC|nr:hypothetical protein TNIN_359721 [Trichonephila inaurata madagascariensis]